MRRFDYSIMADFVDKKGCDDVFSWDFCWNKAVKFNSGQYMNDTLEGDPWAPILVGGYFTGAAVIWEYAVVLIDD